MTPDSIRSSNSPPTGDPARHVRHLRDAFAASRGPRFLLHLFDLPDGEHLVGIDAPAIPAPAIFEPWQAPKSAQVQVETTEAGRWAYLSYGIRMTEDAETVYFVATLIPTRLAAAFKDSEAEPSADDDTFTVIDVEGATSPDLVLDFLETLNFPMAAEAGTGPTPILHEGKNERE